MEHPTLLWVHRRRLEVRQGRLPCLPQLQAAHPQGRRRCGAPGVWFECQNCLTKTSVPKVIFTCREGHEFSTSDVRLAAVYTYAVEESVVAQLKNALILAPALAELLTSMGYLFCLPRRLPGPVRDEPHPRRLREEGGGRGKRRCGRRRDPDNRGRRDGSRTPSAVISFFAKTYDLKPRLALLITIPSASEAAKQDQARGTG